MIIKVFRTDKVIETFQTDKYMVSEAKLFNPIIKKVKVYTDSGKCICTRRRFGKPDPQVYAAQQMQQGNPQVPPIQNPAANPQA